MLYYVNKREQPTGEHEVHTSSCIYIPSEENKMFLGNFDSCRDAVREAGKHFDSVDGCRHCSKACHTR